VKKGLKNSIAALLLVIIFFLGYIRETSFLILNTVINNYPFPYNASYVSPPNFLYSFNNQTLIAVKWGLTFGFSVIFFLMSFILINFYFKNKNFNKITSWAYLFLVGVSFLIALLGIIMGSFDETYALSRFFIGLAQSPLVPLVLVVLFYFKNKVEIEEINP